MLLLLVIVGLSLVFVSKSLTRTPKPEAEGQSIETAVQEAERVKALLEGQQKRLEERAERHRD